MPKDPWTYKKRRRGKKKAINSEQTPKGKGASETPPAITGYVNHQLCDSSNIKEELTVSSYLTAPFNHSTTLFPSSIKIEDNSESESVNGYHFVSEIEIVTQDKEEVEDVIIEEPPVKIKPEIIDIDSDETRPNSPSVALQGDHLKSSETAFSNDTLSTFIKSENEIQKNLENVAKKLENEVCSLKNGILESSETEIWGKNSLGKESVNKEGILPSNFSEVTRVKIESDSSISMRQSDLVSTNNPELQINSSLESSNFCTFPGDVEAKNSCKKTAKTKNHFPTPCLTSLTLAEISHILSGLDEMIANTRANIKEEILESSSKEEEKTPCINQVQLKRTDELVPPVIKNIVEPLQKNDSLDSSNFSASPEEIGNPLKICALTKNTQNSHIKNQIISNLEINNQLLPDIEQNEFSQPSPTHLYNSSYVDHIVRSMDITNSPKTSTLISNNGPNRETKLPSTEVLRSIMSSVTSSNVDCPPKIHSENPAILIENSSKALNNEPPLKKLKYIEKDIMLCTTPNNAAYILPKDNLTYSTPVTVNKSSTFNNVSVTATPHEANSFATYSDISVRDFLTLDTKSPKKLNLDEYRKKKGFIDPRDPRCKAVPLNSTNLQSSPTLSCTQRFQQTTLHPNIFQPDVSSDPLQYLVQGRLQNATSNQASNYVQSSTNTVRASQPNTNSICSISRPYPPSQVNNIAQKPIRSSENLYHSIKQPLDSLGLFSLNVSDQTYPPAHSSPNNTCSSKFTSSDRCTTVGILPRTNARSFEMNCEIPLQVQRDSQTYKNPNLVEIPLIANPAKESLINKSVNKSIYSSTGENVPNTANLFPVVQNAYKTHGNASKNQKQWISLLPHSLKSVGNGFIHTNDVYLIIIDWHPDWFAFEDQSSNLPFISKCLQVKNTYKSVLEYYNTYFPLLLLECWQRIHIAMKELKRLAAKTPSMPHLCKITSSEQKAHYIDITCEIELPSREFNNMPKEGYVILAKFSTGINRRIKMLGYVHSMSQEPMYPNKSGFQFRGTISFYIVYKADEIEYRFVEISKLYKIKKILHQNEVLRNLHESPLCDVILNPLMEDVQAFHLPAYYETTRLYTIVQSVAEHLRVPVPQIVLLKANEASGPFNAVVCLLNELKKSSECDHKFIICMRTEDSLAALGRNLMNGYSGKFVILSEQENVPKELQNYTLKKLALDKKNELREKSPKENSSTHEVVLKESSVMLVLISNCFSQDIKSQLEDGAITYCIITDASQCTEPDSIIPLLYRIQKLILMGNPDTPCKIYSKIAQSYEYNKSLFHRTFNTS